MQNYKDWVFRWLNLDNDFGGALANLIYSDVNFPSGGDKTVIQNRLKQLGASEKMMIAFHGCWRTYEKDIKKNIKESCLENFLVKEVKSRGGICWKFTSPGTSGVPDRIVMAPNGKVAFVEMKAPGKKLRPIQQKRADEIIKCKGIHYCIDSYQKIYSFLTEVFGGDA